MRLSHRLAEIDEKVEAANNSLVQGRTGEAHVLGKAAERLLLELTGYASTSGSVPVMRRELNVCMLLAHTYRDYPGKTYPLYYIERSKLLAGEVSSRWQGSLFPYIAMEEAQAAITMNDIGMLDRIVGGSSYLADDESALTRVRYWARFADVLTFAGRGLELEKVMRLQVVPGSIDVERPDLTAGHYTKYAQSLISLGRFDAAWSSLDIAARILDEHESAYFRMRLATIRGEIAIETGDRTLAEVCYAETERIRILAQIDVKRSVELRDKLRLYR